MAKNTKVDADQDMTALMRICTQIFSTAIIAHRDGQPEDCARWLTLFAEGKAEPFVLIEQGKAAQCGFRLVGSQQRFVFAFVPTNETAPAWIN